ncbi:MAG: gamma-glutamylcyclotransferase [Betaproteobacteria bacterium AqS2]|uniref:glutathione-specific gamma-glutamylcyclotransferase n=1 Tax=Candidatus Amphirhobacter heronislandensis TaxID=1732024 RepID=A0A930UDY9_9GAMM|nr:gamma-glutamylcyclotransferase [Betaproteobacteria bacterium AqS2]
MSPAAARPSPSLLRDLAALGRLPAGADYRDAAVFRGLLAAWTAAATSRPLAVFAYASLLWDCDFVPRRRTAARLHGFARRPCIYSTCYRGTPRRPGLVLGLDRGGSCTGMALALPAQPAAALRALFEREVFQGVYYPRLVAPRPLAGGAAIACLAFVSNPLSKAYAPDLAPAEIRRIIATARGRRGPCVDYWRSTCARLRELGGGADLERHLPA